MQLELTRSTPFESQEKIKEYEKNKLKLIEHKEKIQKSSRLASDQNKEWFLSSINCLPPTIDQILEACIKQIWNTYDDDNSGYLDREEAYKFVQESISNSEEKIPIEIPGVKLSFVDIEKKE